MLPRALLVLLAAAAVPAAGETLSGIRRGEALHAGESRLVRLAAQTGREEHGDEAELVLSLDGGKTFALRVSQEVDPAGDVDAFVFRVPSLPSTRAVLGLRAGHDGEDERVVALSEPFVVVASASSSLEPLRKVRGELATREASVGGTDEAPGTGVGPVGTSLAAAAGALDVEDANGFAHGPPVARRALLSAPNRATGRHRPSRSPEALPSPFCPKRE